MLLIRETHIQIALSKSLHVVLEDYRLNTIDGNKSESTCDSASQLRYSELLGYALITLNAVDLQWSRI